MLLPLFLIGCAPMQTVETKPGIFTPRIPLTLYPSANFDGRRPNYVVLHHTSDDTAEEALATLTAKRPGVSAHYLVSRDGRILQLVDERMRAWHAGASYWKGQRDLNSASIGIELDNNGSEAYPEVQIVALLTLLEDLRVRYRLPPTAFIGHGDIAPGRKVDPSEFFPWRRLATRGYGIWCEPPHSPAPPGIEDDTLLNALGYDVRNLQAAVLAFKRRFRPDDRTPLMTANDRAMLWCLVQTQRGLLTDEYPPSAVQPRYSIPES